MLHAAGLNLPTRVHVHGFLKVEGTKMSKSRGTFVNARTYLDYLDPQYLRFYYAAKLSAKPDDIDLAFEDFVNRVNADLVNKIVNLYSRSLRFVSARLDGRLGKLSSDGRKLVDSAAAAADEIAEHFENRNLAGAVFRIVQLAEQGNQYLQDAAPWKLVKNEPEQAREVCTAAANFGLLLAIYLKPVLPELVAKIEEVLGTGPLSWADLGRRLEDVDIQRFERLLDRVERQKLDDMIEAARQEFEQLEQGGGQAFDYEVDPLTDECTIEDFAGVDLRVAEVLEAGEVEGAKKLLQLKLNLGPLGHRQVFAGIRASYPDPSVLVGRKVICVANLKPRKMRFGTSEGMVCASSTGNERVRVIQADDEALPGDRVS